MAKTQAILKLLLQELLTSRKWVQSIITEMYKEDQQQKNKTYSIHQQNNFWIRQKIELAEQFGKKYVNKKSTYKTCNSPLSWGDKEV